MQIVERPPGRLRAALARFTRWEYAWLLLIVLVTLGLHAMVVARPNSPVFDEIYYINDARTILQQHITDRTEHPPLAKLIIAGSTMAFGDNQYGWRIPSIIFGTAGIVFFYLVCRNLDLSRRASTLGTFVFATENLYFTMSSLALLDIFMVTFMLLAFWLYLRRSYPLAAVAVALSTLAKFNGVFTVIAIALHWFIKRRDKPVKFVASAILALGSFLGLLAAFDVAIYHKMIDVIYWLGYGLKQTDSLTFVTAAHPSMTRPWDWVLFPEIMPFGYGPHYIGVVSFTVWALIVPALVYFVIKAVKNKDDASMFSLAWFAGTWGVWIPLDLFTNRVTFIYYFLPAVGAIVVGIGMGLDRLIDIWQRREGAPAGLPGVQPEVLALQSQTAPAAETPPDAAATQAAPGGEAGEEVRSIPRKWYRKTKLQWAAISFVVLFLLLQVAVFVIIAPPLNNWPIQNWLPR